MESFADRLIQAIEQKSTPCVVGLDPRVNEMPQFIVSSVQKRFGSGLEAAAECIIDYHRRILDLVAPLIPAVKPQIAFFEQFGLPGMKAFEKTLQMAKERNLLVIADVKRNDIASTAQAYANAYLGQTDCFGKKYPVFNVDCVTVSPYMGHDSLLPFVSTCNEYGKGIFILVKTSNPSTKDFQDQTTGSASRLYEKVADQVNHYAKESIGKHGFSSIGAVVGATYPEEACALRERMPYSIFLVPGYGTQGGTPETCANCFHPNGLGAVINASRSTTYQFEDLSLTESEFEAIILERVLTMKNNINQALEVRKNVGKILPT